MRSYRLGINRPHVLPKGIQMDTTIMPDEPSARLLDHHRDQLRRSGLTEDTVLAAGLYSVTTASDAKRLLNWTSGGGSPPLPALAFPYPGTDYVRLRPDSPRSGGGKYEAPVGSPTRMYIPPAAAERVRETDRPLYLVEGEKKALAAAQAGLAVVGAPGVHSFHDVEARRERGRWVLHPDLVPLVANGRTVVLVFDSDTDQNPDVMAALARVAAMVRDAGGKASLAIPQGATGAKVGLDDLYVACGGDGQRLRERLKGAERPADPDEYLDYLRERWAQLSAAEQSAELRRAYRFADAFYAEEQVVKLWVKKAATALKQPQSIIESYGWPDDEQSDEDSEWSSAPGFRVNASGIRVVDADGKAGREVAAAPINVMEVGVDEHDLCYLGLKWKYGNDTMVAHVPREEVFGPDIMKLAAKGAPVTQANKNDLQTFLQRQEQEVATGSKTRIFTQFGWMPNLDGFVLGPHVVGVDGRSIASADASFLDAYTTKGSRKEYRELCDTIRRESPLAEMMWAAGYAGPLLRLLALRSVVLSIWGTSSSGKSALQALAVSPFGRPEGLMTSGDVSEAALEGLLLRSRDQTMWYDDTQLTRRETLLDNLSYQVGAGVSRSRATQTGALREMREWLTGVAVSGERPVLGVNAPAGARNRTIELPMVPLDKLHPRQIHEALKGTHGHFGKEYIEKLVSADKSNLRRWHKELRSIVGEEKGETANNLALLMTANALARIFIFGEAETDARDAAIKMGVSLLASAEQASTKEQDPTSNLYANLVAFVTQHHAHFESNATEPYGKNETYDRDRVVAILPPVFNRAVKELGLEPQQATAYLLSKDLLVRGDGNHVPRKTTIGGNRMRAYWLKLRDDDARPQKAAARTDTDASNYRPSPCPPIESVAPPALPTHPASDLDAMTDEEFAALYAPEDVALSAPEGSRWH